jgi:hypothetical protein
VSDDEYSDPDISDSDEDFCSDCEERSLMTQLDERNISDPRKIPQYAELVVMKSIEDDANIALSSAAFHANQTEITPKIREVCIKWMIAKAQYLAVTGDTIYNAIMFLDIVLCAQHVDKDWIHLLITTCLWTASKVEEIASPALETMVDMGRGAFSIADLVNCERYLIQALGFRTDYPTTKLFLRRILDATDANEVVNISSNFMAEVSLLELECLDFPRATTAAAAVCLGFHGLGLSCPVQVIEQHAHIKQLQDLQDCINLVIAKGRKIMSNADDRLMKRYRDDRLNGALNGFRLKKDCVIVSGRRRGS